MISTFDITNHINVWLSDGFQIIQIDNGNKCSTTSITAQTYGIKLLEDKNTYKSEAIIYVSGMEHSRRTYRYGNLTSTVPAYRELTKKIYGYSDELKYIKPFVQKFLNEMSGKNLRAISIMGEKDYFKISGATHSGKEFLVQIRYTQGTKGKSAKTTLTIDGKNNHEVAMGITGKINKMIAKINSL